MEPLFPTRSVVSIYMCRYIYIYIYQYINILSVCLCVTDVESSEGGTTCSSTVTMRPSNLFYLLCTACMCMISSRCTHGAAAEVDVVGEKQLKQMQSGRTSV